MRIDPSLKGPSLCKEVKCLQSGAGRVSGLTGLGTSGESSQLYSLVILGLAGLREGRVDLEKEEGSEFRLGQQLNRCCGQLAHIPLTTPILVHSVQGIKDQLFTGLFIRLDRSFATAGSTATSQSTGS